MKAFQSVRAAMRDTCAEIAHPAANQSVPSARIVRVSRGRSDDDDDEGRSHIDPWMEAAFYGLTHASETGDPFALVSCFMNGKPAAIIAATHNDGRRTHIMPLFLACQPWMKFAGHDEDSGDEGGGPDRADASDPPAPR